MGWGSHAFIYDELANDPRMQREISEIEAALTALDLHGQVGRLSLFRRSRDLIEQMVHHGARTIVIVGNDQTVAEVMGFLPDLPVVLGYLPIGKGEHTLALALGIPRGARACDMLAARRMEVLDVGKCNGQYFFTRCTTSNASASLEIQGAYRIRSEGAATLSIVNLPECPAGDLSSLSSAQDGNLEAVIQPRITERSSFWRTSAQEATHIFFQEGTLTFRESEELWVDGIPLKGKTFQLSCIPSKLHVITGRSRSVELEGEVSYHRPFTQRHESVLKDKVYAGPIRRRKK